MVHGIDKVQLRVVPSPALLGVILEESASRHRHLCPRQVLGVRIGLAGLRTLGLVGTDFAPRFVNQEKRLLTIVETDGCGADGIAIATDCYVGRRTLRVLDFGKVAATLIDTSSGIAVRVCPTCSARSLAIRHTPSDLSPWRSYLQAYQTMSDHELLTIERVQLTRSLAEILSKPGLRVNCDECCEEVMNEREVWLDGKVLCRACAGDVYYRRVIDDKGD